MSLETRELHPGLAAEAGFLDLSQPLDPDTIAAIQTAIDAYPVLVFRSQSLTDAQLRDFAARFGPLEIGRSAARPGRRRLAIPQIGDISNLDVDNKVRALDDRRRLDGLGNRLWHTDASYMPVPVVLGLLHAKVLPPPSPFGNGETEFADMRAAYDALPETMKQISRSVRRLRPEPAGAGPLRAGDPDSTPDPKVCNLIRVEIRMHRAYISHLRSTGRVDDNDTASQPDGRPSLRDCAP